IPKEDLVSAFHLENFAHIQAAPSLETGCSDNGSASQDRRCVVMSTIENRERSAMTTPTLGTITPEEFDKRLDESNKRLRQELAEAQERVQRLEALITRKVDH